MGFYWSCTSPAVLASSWAIYNSGGATYFRLTTATTNDHKSSTRFKSMPSSNGGNYGGPYSCDGRVDKLESTQLIPIIGFLIQGHTLKQNINENYLQHKLNYSVLKTKLIILYPTSFVTWIGVISHLFSLGDRYWQPIGKCLVSFPRYAVHFGTNTQYSKTLNKHIVNYIYFIHLQSWSTLSWVGLNCVRTIRF